MSKGKAAKYLGRGLTSCAIAGAMVAMSCGVGFAASASKIDSSNKPVEVDSNLLTTVGVRAGSAGPDFLGITNMNYDFQPSHGANAIGDPYPYYKVVEGKTSTGYKANLNTADHFNRLAIWGSGVNEAANPYYQNLLVNALLGEDKAEKGGLPDGYKMATTYHTNPGSSSWGDVVCDNQSVITKEYAPDIIFGANKMTNWNESYSANTKTSEAAKAAGYNPTYANNDSTNVWTQIYTMQQLAATANKATSNSAKYTRYDGGDASVTALAYEKSIKGQMLYVASQLDAKKTPKKKVAYLYAIDTEANKAYFFVPKAEGLVSGDDTSCGVNSGDQNSAKQDVYGANNSTINMGYMATLPFITNTFGTAKGEGTVRKDGIQMKVEDIFKKNPVVEVTSSTAKDAMKDVDLIIYNSTTQTGSMVGTSNGLCSDEDVKNTAALNDASVKAWAANYGFKGSVLPGDDYGTSTKQSAADTVGVTTGSAPMLYCARNYTVDKNARAAWAFSKVYPELYGNNDDASYAYWLQEIYHIKGDQVNSVLAAYTHQNASTVNVYNNNTSKLNDFAQTGYNWYMQKAGKTYTSKYAYYNGSSRASYYSGNASSEEPKKTIGIFQPSTLWTASSNAVLKASKAKVTVKKGKTVSVKISGAKKAVKASVAKKSGLKLKATKTKLTVTAPKTAKKGTYTVKITSSKAVSTSVKVTVK